MTNSNKPVDDMTFEDALSQLEEIVKKVDMGQENLADAVANFERGVVLKKHCEKLLNTAKLKVEKIATSTDNQITISEVDIN